MSVEILHDGARLDFESGAYLRGKKSTILTRKEAKLLALLMRNAGRTVSRETIVSKVFKGRKANSVDVYINYLRNKDVVCITTVQGEGYRYCGTCKECRG